MDKGLKSDRTIVLFTDSYPYGYGEAFLETEIQEISKKFIKIIIVPDAVSNGVCRKLPDNVKILYSETDTVGWSNVMYCLLYKPLIRKEFLQNLIDNPLRNKVLLKTLRAAMNKEAQIRSFCDLLDSEDLVYYSYWLNHNAIAICLTDEKLIRVSRMHGWDVYEERQKYQYLPLRPFLHENLDRIYAISQDGLTHIQKKYRINNALVLSRLGVACRNIDVKSDQNFSKMISISSLISLKRIDLLGKAYAAFKNKDLAWEHYGTGENKESIEAEFGKKTFKGQVSNAEVCEMMQQYMESAFLINVSSYEGIPVSMMEAMSFGIPCIGTNVGGVSEIIQDGYNGYLLSANPSIEEVITTIHRMLDLSGEEALKMRKAAYETWKEKYNAEINYAKFAEELNSLA